MLGASMSMFGVIRPSHRGVHQECLPTCDMTAGTSTMRITLASMSTAAAMPASPVLTHASCTLESRNTS
ncbi:MAG: hypothetical protein ABJA87_04895 [bacterium]